LPKIITFDCKRPDGSGHFYFNLVIIRVFTISMTSHTIVRIIVFLIMLPIHFAVIMAGGAGVIVRIPAGMTLGTLAVCPFMIDGESVVKGCAAPRTGIVAVGTLALEVVRRPCMARLAVRQPVVAEIHILEVARILMAGCTRAPIMALRC
jgi:hypothetical protein